MDITFTFNITPHLMEQLIASGITLALFATLAWAVRKFIGE